MFIVSNPKLKHKDDAKFIKALRELYTAENKITPSITELRNMGRQLRATLPKKTQDITNRSQPIKINKFNDLQSDILPSKRQLNAYKASLDKATAEKELTKLQTLESKLQAKRDKISTQDLPEEYLEVAIKTWDELAKGNALSTNVVRGLVYETTRPLLGGISGGMLGVIADPNIQNAEDLFSQRMLGYVMAGALLGQWQKSIQRNTYNIRESKYNKFLRVFGEEKDKVLKRSLNTVLKEATAGTHSSWMQASIDPIRKLGAKLYKVQGAELNMNAKLPQMPVEQASSVMENYYIRRSYDIMKNVDHDDLIAAGRILNNKGINPAAKYKFIKEGDLENAEKKDLETRQDKRNEGKLSEDWKDAPGYSSKEAGKIMNQSLREYAKVLRKAQYKVIKDWMNKSKAGVLDFFDISRGLKSGDVSRAHPYETEFLRNVLRKDKVIDRFRSYTGGRKRKR